MKAKSNFSYRPSKGITIAQKKLTLPSQSLTIREILKRFTRGEKVSVGTQTFHEDFQDVDLEKLKYADLIDRAEFSEKLKQISETFKTQEKNRQRLQIEKEVQKRLSEQAQVNAQKETGGSNKAANVGQS